MNLRQIIEKHLKDNGFDGLCGDECGCQTNELWPCDSPDMDVCRPGYKRICPGANENCEGCPIPSPGSNCMTTKKEIK